ncbi:MAG TPA: potassium transporter KefB, partial [Chromatiales bacterium]|nr:potassium transporter KefB [Chromatiales bacterium]
FAEAGVVLLMFTIGLEFSLTRLLAAKKLVLGVGGAQVTSITLLGSLVFLGLGVQPVLAVILGGGIAMSSTAITLKQLGEQGELGMVHGKVATGILLFQDVAAIPFLVLLPLLGNGGPGQEEALWLTLARAAAVFLILVMLGRHLLPRLLHWVAGTHSLELFMLVVLTLALGAAALTLLAGLSATLGAFMAGMLLGETRFRYQIEADIRPFRDLMLGVFFISIGMRLDPAILMDEPGAILLVLAALIMVKALLMTLLVRGFGYDWFESARSAVVLAQGGEFGLLLVAQVIAIGGVQSEFLQPVLAGLIISMLIAPVLIRLNHPLAQLLTGRPPGRLETDRLDNLAETTEGMQEHVILCGYGHLGQGIARILREQD